MALLIGEPAQAQDTASPYAGVFANAEITMTLNKGGLYRPGAVRRAELRPPVAGDFEVKRILLEQYSVRLANTPNTVMLAINTFLITTLAFCLIIYQSLN